MNLGEDLEIEILMRLPAKSLMRFKCVQRSWNNLIKTPYFVSKRSKLNIPENKSLLIIEKSNLKLLSCDSDNEKPILIKSLFSNNVRRIEFYGSCNGVFCLKGIYPRTTNHDQLIIWNPTTNEVHLIPRAPSLGNCYIDESLYGFGVVNDDDFKVVRLSLSHIHGLNEFYLSLVEVYNLSTRSWTPILNRPSGTMVTRQQPLRYNTLVNGVYHWITSSSRYYAATILCFDFRNNRFQQFEGPNLSHALAFFDEDVIEINGSLGYVVQSRYFAVGCMEIWIMKQNKWERKYNIDPIRSQFCIYGLWNDCAEILGGKVGQKQLTSYDHHGNSIRQFQIDILENDNLLMYEYVPSIALLSK